MKDVYFYNFFPTPISTSNSNLFTLFCLQSCCPCMCTAVYLHFFVYKVCCPCMCTAVYLHYFFYKVVVSACVLQLFYIFCLKVVFPGMCSAVYSHYFVYKVVVLACVLQLVHIILFTKLLSFHVYCSLFTLFCLQGCCPCMCTAVGEINENISRRCSEKDH